MENYYLICGRTVSVASPLPLAEHENFALFTTRQSSADLHINYKIVDELPVPSGECKLSAGGTAVYCRGGEVWRNTPMGTQQGALSHYRLGGTSHSTVYFTPCSYKTMSDYRYMWQSVSLGQLLLPFGVLLMHASYISVNGGAVLFTAPSGVGKSTQAELWRIFKGAEVINGDKAGVSVGEGGVYAHGLPFCGTSGICKNRTLPLKAIVLLEQSADNRIERVAGLEAVQSLVKNIYLDFLAPGETQGCIDVLLRLLGTVPVYRLRCTPDERAVQTLASTLNI